MSDMNIQTDMAAGHRNVIEVKLTQACLLVVSATWTGGPQQLAAIVNVPGRPNCDGRRDSGSPLKLEHMLHKDDITQGFVNVSVINFSNEPARQVNISIRVEPIDTQIKPVDFTNPLVDMRRIGRFFSAEEDHEGLAFGPGNLLFLSSSGGIRVFSLSGSNQYDPSGWRHMSSKSEGEIFRDVLMPEEKRKQLREVKAVACSGGVIFAPVEGPERPILVGLTADTHMHIIGYSPLKTVNDSVGFCTVNPNDGHLYTILDYFNAKQIHQFDVLEYYNALKRPAQTWGGEIPLPECGPPLKFFKEDGVTPDEVGQAQGAAFSKNGRIYVSWYSKDGIFYENYLAVYDTKSGRRTSRWDNINFDDVRDEIEGLAMHPSGVLYISVCINKDGFDNPFDIHAIRSRDPNMPL